MCRVGQNHLYTYIYSVYTVYLAGESPNIWSYAVMYSVLANPIDVSKRRHRCVGISKVGQNRIYTPYDRIFGDFPAKNTVYTPYIYMVLANPR
jgi:hypothetical protein